jgi:phospholipid/cholesterol/gamma-HCH transport system substrate-binding protein
MSDRGQPFRVGVVVLATMLIGALLVALNANVSLPFGQGQKTVQIQLPSAPGVDENTPVRKNGVLIGRVTRAQFTDDGVLLTASISAQDDRPLFTTDLCRVQPSSILGDAVVSFTTPPLPPGTPRVVVSEGAILTGDVVPSPIDVLVNLQTDVGPAIKSLGQAGDAVTTLAGRLNIALGEDTGKQRIGQLLDQSISAMNQFSETMEQMKSAMTTLDTLFGDPQLRDQLKGALQEMPGLVTDARKTFQSLDGVVSSAENNLKNLEGLTQPLGERGPELAQLVTSSAENLEILLSDAGEFVDSLNNSQGTIGRLVKDPELYTNVNTVVCNVNVVLGRINDIALRLRPVIEDVRVFTDKVAREPGRIISGAAATGIGVK